MNEALQHFLKDLLKIAPTRGANQVSNWFSFIFSFNNSALDHSGTPPAPLSPNSLSLGVGPFEGSKPLDHLRVASLASCRSHETRQKNPVSRGSSVHSSISESSGCTKCVTATTASLMTTTTLTKRRSG